MNEFSGLMTHYGTDRLLIRNTLNIRGGHAQLFFEFATAIPQLEGSTSAIAIPQLFKKCCSATATPQFRNRNLKSYSSKSVFSGLMTITNTKKDYYTYGLQIFSAGLKK
jgi:hypothetical protein